MGRLLKQQQRLLLWEPSLAICGRPSFLPSAPGWALTTSQDRKGGSCPVGHILSIQQTPHPIHPLHPTPCPSSTPHTQCPSSAPHTLSILHTPHPVHPTLHTLSILHTPHPVHPAHPTSCPSSTPYTLSILPTPHPVCPANHLQKSDRDSSPR